MHFKNGTANEKICYEIRAGGAVSAFVLHMLAITDMLVISCICFV